jgi:centrosomal CEP192-like protein
MLMSRIVSVKLPRVSLIALFLVVLSSASVRAQNIISVPTSEPTIQAAINAANNGDTVLVAPGTYVENINFSGKAIAVTSSGGPAVTVIDGGAQGPVVTFNQNEPTASQLSGFTIRNGFQPIGPGGGISIKSASPTISNDIITGNHAVYGIGIYINDGSPVIRNNTITNNDQTGANTGGFGGSGVTIDGIDPLANPRIIGNAITNNSPGGGISVISNGIPLIQGNIIQGNTASSDGGGFSFQGYGSPTVLENFIVGNTSGNNGGGMWISPYNANYGAPILVINNTIVGNSDGAPHETSGIYTTGFAQSVTFINNIVVAVPGQNAITCDNSYSSVSPVFSHNDAYSFRGAGFTGWCIASPNSGNFSSDPIFLNSDNNDFHLSQSSPAIDAGDNAAPNLPSADFDGNPRVADGNGDGVAVIDLGAYEVVNTSAANLSPISLSFNPQGVGTTSPAQPVLLSSSGSTSFQITSIQISSGFTQTSNCPVLIALGNTTGVAGGSSCIFSVGFDPTYAVSLSGSLTVNGTNGAAVTTLLNGTGTTGPVASLSTASLAFPAQVVGTVSASQTVMFTNSGAGTVSTSSITANGPFSQSNNCGSALAAGSSCAISVAFSPSAYGPSSNTLVIRDNVSGLNYSVSLSGAGVDFSVSTSISSPNVLAGSSVNIPVYVNPLGGNFVNSVSPSCAGLPNNSTCSFSPANVVPGSNVATSTMTISTSQAGTPGGVFPVTVTGVSGSTLIHSAQLQLTILKPVASLSATSLVFSGQVVGSKSSPQTLTLTNSNVAPVNISSIIIGAPFTLSSNCASALQVNSSCSITVVFSPVVYGPASGTLAIQDNADGLSYSANLSGTGVDYSIVPAVNSETIARGESATTAINLLALGGTFNNPVALSCSGLPSKSICSFSPSSQVPGSIGASSAMTISTDQSATQVGMYTVTVTGTSGGLSHSAQVQLTISKARH